ncbi:MAG: PrsW family intramembrane metalloprotease [Lewinellaceae bacterium]|nr:PrsW family intramembrane metalloprotease [Lewinellaceae bacterium]
MNLFLLFLAALPGVLISYAIFRADKYEHEPMAPLALCFVLGAAATFPVMEVERRVVSGMEFPQYNLPTTILLSFGVLALTEEVAKFVLLRVVVFPRSFFNEPMDGIVYAVLIAMGFATMENIFYASRFGLQTVLVRSFTAVPAHLAFAIVQGYFAGLARFNTPNQTRLLLRGLGLAVLLHGTYDLLILQGWSRWLVALGTFALYLNLFFLGRLVQEQQERSPFRKHDGGT